MNEKTKNIFGWVITVLLAVWMVAAASGKLMGNEEVAAMFANAQLPDWFMPVTGVLEVAGAIGLFIPKLRRLAAMCLIGLMCGALYTHFKVGDPFTSYIGALAVIGLASLLLWRHYDDED